MDFELLYMIAIFLVLLALRTYYAEDDRRRRK